MNNVERIAVMCRTAGITISKPSEYMTVFERNSQIYIHNGYLPDDRLKAVLRYVIKRNLPISSAIKAVSGLPYTGWPMPAYGTRLASIREYQKMLARDSRSCKRKHEIQALIDIAKSDMLAGHSERIQLFKMSGYVQG